MTARRSGLRYLCLLFAVSPADASLDQSRSLRGGVTRAEAASPPFTKDRYASASMIRSPCTLVSRRSIPLW